MDNRNYKNRIYRKEVFNRKPSDDAHTTVCVTNHIIEIKAIRSLPGKKASIKKLNKNQYLNCSTGEICNFQRGEEKVRKKNMNPSFERLRRLINYNFTGKNSELHIVLTYAENVTDRTVVGEDMKRFWKRFRYKYPNCEYVAIFEPTSKGRWHIHMLVKDREEKELFLPVKEVKEIWGLGGVNLNHIYDNDNIGAYFSVMISGYEGYVGSSKKRGRLQYYSKNAKLYTRSKGIASPPVLHVTYKEAMEMVRGLIPTFQRDYAICWSEDDIEMNVVYIRQYNLKRQ